jgi:hypothetical protein
MRPCSAPSTIRSASSRAIVPLLPLPFLPLPRPHDGKVSLAATHVEGSAGHLVLPVTHTLMVYDSRVIAAALAFIETGRFGEAHVRSAALDAACEA